MPYSADQRVAVLAYFCATAGAVRSGDRMAESAASLIPASVPRPAAKLAVLGVGGLIAFWLLQKVRELALEKHNRKKDMPRVLSQVVCG